MFNQSQFDAHKTELDQVRRDIIALATLNMRPWAVADRGRELIYLMTQNEAGIDPRVAQVSYTPDYWNDKLDELKKAMQHCYYEV
jgi:hypothetical protein